MSSHKKVYANTAEFYSNRAKDKYYSGDYYGAISDYTKAIEINPNYALGFGNRGAAKEKIGDMQGACNDWRKASYLGYESAAKWLRNQC